MSKRIINIFVWTIVCIYLTIVILSHIPAIQNGLGKCVSDALCDKFGTRVTIGRVDLGFINRLIIDDAYIYDKSGKQMLKVSRTSVKIDLIDLINKKITITSAQFFGLQAYAYKATEASKPNYQFILDSLASKDTTKHTPLNLKINSLIIRNGSIRYRCLWKPASTGKFSLSDLGTSNISAHLIINTVTDDSLNVKIKKLSFKEKSGFELRSMSLHLIANKTNATLRSLNIELPSTKVTSDKIEAQYAIRGKSIEPSSITYNGNIEASKITPSDFACFIPVLKPLKTPFYINTKLNGTKSELNISRLLIGTFDEQFSFAAKGNVKFKKPSPEWTVDIQKLKSNDNFICSYYQAITKKDAPDIIHKLGDIDVTGTASSKDRNLTAAGNIGTDVGRIKFDLKKHDARITVNTETADFKLSELTGDKRLGKLSAKLSAEAEGKDKFSVTGLISSIDYNDYRYKDIHLDAAYSAKVFNGHIDIADNNINLSASGTYNHKSASPVIGLTAEVKDFSPNALSLTEKWKDTRFSFDINADLSGKSIHDFIGEIALNNFLMKSPSDEYALNGLHAKAGYADNRHYINLTSDFGHIDITGDFDISSITGSITNMVQSKLPTIPGLTRKEVKSTNDFAINAVLTDTEWLRNILDIPLSLQKPMSINGSMDNRHNKINLECELPAFSYKDTQYKDAKLNITTPDDSLHAVASIKKISAKGKVLALDLKAGASDNRLKTSFSFMNNERHPLKGIINASSHFAKNEEGASTAYIEVLESKATIGDTTWHVRPSNIIYSKNHLEVRNFAIQHDKQYLAINGTATKNAEDTLHIDLNDINVSYILNLVNFHSVEFSGAASGHGYLAGLFADTPKTGADLTVKDFRFENGRMGTLYAHVGYNDTEGRIEIDAKAKDEGDRSTIINGYVSPRHNYIDLGIQANNTRAEFMESFCNSFMDNVNADINGTVNVVGPLNNINLVGKAEVNGSVRISSLNTTYWMRGDSVRFIPDEIKFLGDTIYDRNGNIGILTGSVYHKHLTNLSYDLNIEAHNLLAYDTHTFGDNTFYGTAYTTGECSIKGKSGEVTIDIQATPNANSILVYNVTDRNELSNQEFIQGREHPSPSDSTDIAASDDDHSADNNRDVSTNIRLNFIINCNTDATIKLLMDERTGDYITLNGDGALRASYFNKGAFEIYGNYIVDHGIYKLTIQNILKKDFIFQKGGTIAFGGNPYNAALDLKAQYVLNGVSLSDLNIGRSFSNNNIRVNCLMNVSGTPFSPKVDFSLDMPSLSNDAKQMVYSLLNAEEEMNQQVLYLLAVGRFYNQGTNNSAGDNVPQYSQASLAMQSFLSGTISQQLNTVLSNVIDNNNWNFGANISTGTEGFNNAEYEGLLSGRLLNNRLLINGQFGYRDKAYSTTSFIGDFDLRYLLFPNGNLAVNVYNKTNDRYFTRNSLNTQGIGIIMKKDFNGFRDLFFNKKRKKK